MQIKQKLLSLFLVFISCICLNTQKCWSKNIIRDAEIESVVYKVIDPLLAQINKSRKDVSVYIVADPALNAYVQGGQNIFIHTGLIIALENKQQLAAVLAHELGHITGGHLLKSYDAASEAMWSALITSAAVGVAAALAGGGADAISGALMAGSQAGSGSFNAFSRTQEASADQAAIQLLTKAQINPVAMNAVLKQLARNERGATDYMRSHPLSRDRIERINHRLQENKLQKKTYQDIDNSDYQRIKAKLYGFLENPRNTLSRYKQDNNFKPITLLIAQASAYHRLGQSQNALKAINKAIDIKPKDAFIYDLAGQIALENGKINSAIDYYKTAYTLSQKNPLIGFTLGQALIASQKQHFIKQASLILKESLLKEQHFARGLRDLSIAYSYLDNLGLSALTSARYFFLLKNYKMAMKQAKKALTYLQENQPEALQAKDILFFAEKNNRRKKI